MKFARVVLIALAATFFLFGICGHAPAVPEKPRGPARGMVAVVLACTTQTTDPKGADVAYQFDWGDGTRSGWSAFVAGGQAFADTHTYSQPGSYEVKARAKNSKKASGWSEPLTLLVDPAEGGVRWSFAFTDPEDPEDSADFSLNTFGLDLDRDAAYIGCDYGGFIARKLDRTLRWEFVNPDGDEFMGGASVGPDGTVFTSCANDSFYALNPNGTRKWVIYVGEDVYATPAVASNGTVYIHTMGDSLLAVSNGTRLWSCFTGGGCSSPAIGKDGTVYVANQEGSIFALDPTTGTKKWSYSLSTSEIMASPAIDDSLGTTYVCDENGWFASLSLSDLSENWVVQVGEAPSSPVVGPDHTIYVGAGGKLYALDPTNGLALWTYVPPLSDGVVSTPAVSSSGCIYFLVTVGKRARSASRQGSDNRFENPDSLYAVNSNGSRRWACALGEGFSAEFISSPKLDADGNIYIGSGLAAWCVRGTGGPAASPWPMFQADAANTGRAR
ncbi:MAG: PQQ-binding-like beta-propeller repeat protein [candidate division WOR-3 bacterium]